MKAFLKNKFFLVLCAISVAYTLPVYNKFWAPFDEGIILVAAQRLLAGEIPYKDFFIVMYPPGQIYVMGFLLELFSSSLIVGRLYTVAVSTGISLVVFYMTLMLTGKRLISLISWFFVLVALSPRLGAIPAPIWPGVFFSLAALYIYMRYLRRPAILSILFSGFVGGLAVLFRHDIGIFALVSIMGSLFVGFFYDKKAIQKIAFFTAGALLAILPAFLYFAAKSATQDVINSLVLFPFVHQKTAGLSFPAPCFDLRMIFHGSLFFIKVNQYYIPALVYLYAFLHLLKQFFKKELHKKKNLASLSILIFGVLTFNQVITRTDPAHLLTVIAPAAILFGFMLQKTLSRKVNLKSAAAYVYIAIIFSLFVLLSVKNVDKYVKNVFRKIYKKQIVKTRFTKGEIYLPAEERPEVLGVLEYINSNTRPGERIYLGNIVHGKDDFGGSTILYFLADRLPSTKYYEFLPGLITDPAVQREIKNSLVKHNVRLIVLQDIDLGGGSPRTKLDDFIAENYELIKKFGKYNVYMCKES